MKNDHSLEKAILLKKNPIFSTLNLEVLLNLSDKMPVKKFSKGEIIFSPGEEGDCLYFILSGKVSLENKSLDLFKTLKQGAFFGEEAILSQKKRSYRAVSCEEALLMHLKGNHLKSLILECPDLALSFLKHSPNPWY